MRIFKKRLIYLLVGILFSVVVDAETFTLNYDYIGPELAQAYLANSDVILSLAENALDENADASDRLKSLQELKYDFPDAADQVAIILMDSQQPEDLSAEAVDIIANATVMTNHIVKNKVGNTSSGQHWLHKKHQISLDALTKASTNPFAKVRNTAASQGGVLGYAPILDNIQSNIDNGLYTDKEYIRYVGLTSDSNVAVNRLKPYLVGNQDIATQIDAIRIVSSHNEASQTLAEFAFNDSTAKELRVAAIEGLRGRVDYAQALLAVSLNSAEDPEVLEAASTTFSDTVAAHPEQFSNIEIKAAKKAFENQLKTNSKFFDSVRILERIEAHSIPREKLGTEQRF